MPLVNKPVKVKPQQQNAEYQVEVIVSYHGNLKPFVIAHVIGDGVNPYIGKDARLVERYVFDIENPFINEKAEPNE